MSPTGAVPPRAAAAVLGAVLGAGALAGTLAACDAGGTPSAKGTPIHQPTCRNASGFELSLARDTGGQRTPVAAATWFAGHGGVPGLPRHGWRVVSRNADGASVRSGSSTVHVVRGSDGTWQVGGGTRCDD